MIKQSKRALLGSVVLQCFAAGAVLAADDDADSANIYRLGGSYGDDSAYGLQLDADFALTQKTRLQLGGAYVHAHDKVADVNTYQGQLDVDHRVGLWGYSLGGEYRNEGGDIKTYGAHGSAYLQTEQVRAALLLSRRRINVYYDLPALLAQYVESSKSTNSTGYGLSVRYSPNHLSIYANGTYYNYSEPLSSIILQVDPTRVPIAQRPLIQQRLDALRARLNVINATSLRLQGNLLDYSTAVGADYQIGAHSLNIEVSHDRAATDGAVINGVALGWVLPLGGASDMEIRLGHSSVGSTTTSPAASSLYGGITFSFYH
jgi:hypothetical protein